MLADELVHVPTVAELVRTGEAKQVKGGGYALSETGQRKIIDAMEHNGRIMKRDADAREARIDRGNATTEETLAAMQRSELGHKRARQINE